VFHPLSLHSRPNHELKLRQQEAEVPAALLVAAMKQQPQSAAH